LSGYVDRLPLEFEVRERGANVGLNRGSTQFARVSCDLALAVKGADGVIVTQRITEYGALVDRLATVMVNGQTVCLCNAPLGAALQFKQMMRRRNKELQLNIIEVGKLFDSARIEESVLLVSGRREKVSFCGNSRNETRRGLAIANAISEGLVPSSNVIERGLSEVERILRPVFLLFALLGGRAGELDNIGNLVNPGLTKLIVCLDSEIQALAKVYQVVVPSFLETLTHFGGVAWEDADCLGQALINIAGNLLEQRLIEEVAQPISADLAADLLKANMIETFTLLSEFARLSRMRAPVINSVIDLASILTMTDLEKSGRKLSDLGLLGFDVQEIVEMINA
jgi:opine dehydrogenase